MKMYDEVIGEVYCIYGGEESPRLHDTLTEEEKKQLERDILLDGNPGTIPNWSKHYKGNKKNKIENDNIK
ncbi:MAG: hypothetical protein LUG60_01165 [Erysipelotrichaceae bacterium]|nr:hypothetical protein [Erysipelotrichaceae bacterium]